VAFADQQHERLDPQGLTAYSPHRLWVERQPDVNFPGEDAAGDGGAEHLARDDGHVRVVVLDSSEDRSEGLEAGRRGVGEADGPGDTRAGEAGVFGGAFERGERQGRLLEERPARGGELDVAAVTREQVRAERLLELVDLVAERGLGDVEARRGPAEMELLRNGQEVAQQARLEVDRARLSLARDTGLGQPVAWRSTVSCERNFRQEEAGRGDERPTTYKP
jgi:hypothetical protein